MFSDPARERLVPALLGAAAFTGYGIVAAPAPYLLDSAELAHGAYELGVAHPPGEPVAALWGKLWTLLPIGTIAFRVALGQAFAAAVAVALVYHLVRLLGDQIDAATGGPAAAGPSRAVAAAAALLFAFAPGTVISANRAEVYILQTAMALGALALALLAARRQDPRPALLAAGLIGLGLALHPLIAGLAGVGAVVAAWPLLRPHRLRLVGAGVLALLAGAACLVYLPLRTLGGPDLLWGDATSLSGFWWVFTARTFTRKAGTVHLAASPGDTPFVLMEELGPLAALLAVAGLYLVVRKAGTRRAGAAVAVTGAASVLAAVVAGLDPQNPDTRGYLGTAVASVAVLAVLPIRAALGLVRPRAQILVAAGALAAALVVAPTGLSESSRRHAWTGDRVARELLLGLPPSGVLLTSQFQTAFLVGYLRSVEGLRPDVAWAHLGFVRGPAYASRIVRREPDLGPFIQSHATGAPSLTLLRDLDSHRPVRLDVDVHLGPSILGQLRPDGLTWRLDAEGTTAPAPARQAALASLERDIGADLGRDPQARGFEIWRHYLSANLACNNDLGEPLRRHVDRLRLLAPAEPLVKALISRCGVAVPLSP